MKQKRIKAIITPFFFLRLTSFYPFIHFLCTFPKYGHKIKKLRSAIITNLIISKSNYLSNKWYNSTAAVDEEEAEPPEMKTNFFTDISEKNDLDELKTVTYKARSKCKTSTSTCRKCGREVSNKQMEFLHSHINSK